MPVQKSKMGGKGYTFKWTAQEWAVLAPLSEAERTALAMRAVFSGLGLLGQARREGLIGDDAGSDLQRTR